MSEKLQRLEAALREVLGSRLSSLSVAKGEITVVVPAAHYAQACTELRDHAGLQFNQLMDLCGVDYSGYKDGAYDGPRFAVKNRP